MGNNISSTITTALSAVVFTLIICIAAQAGPGELDTTFGNDGVQTLFVNSTGQASAVKSHANRILVAGTEKSLTVLCQLNYDATFDTGFGTLGCTGISELGIGGPEQLAIDPGSGDIFVGGGSGSAVYPPDPTKSNLALARLNAYGQMITTFGTNGVAFNNANQSNGSC